MDAGDGSERHVWCGATNMGPGDVVPLATLGTTMPDGREILKRGILGIDSEGMLCSPVELGIADEASGLLILPADTPLGISPFDALGIEHDVVFDLDLTRAILRGTLKRMSAIWQANILVSSSLVAAISMSASRAPAA